MIESLKDFRSNVVAFICRGRVSAADYKRVLVPAVLKALEANDKIRLYYEIAPDFDGFDPGAMWEDFKIGAEHLTRWERIAMVTDVDWIKSAVNFFRFLMPGELRVFPISAATQAREWIGG